MDRDLDDLSVKLYRLAHIGRESQRPQDGDADLWPLFQAIQWLLTQFPRRKPLPIEAAELINPIVRRFPGRTTSSRTKKMLEECILTAEESDQEKWRQLLLVDSPAKGRLLPYTDGRGYTNGKPRLVYQLASLLDGVVEGLINDAISPTSDATELSVTPEGAEAGAKPSGGDIEFRLSTLMEGHLEVWAKDRAGVLWHTWWWQSGDWSEWLKFDPTVNIASFAVGRYKTDAEELIVVSDQGDLLHRKYAKSTDWEPWVPLDPLPDNQSPRQVALSTLTEEHIELWVIDAAGTLWHCWRHHSDRWTDWEIFHTIGSVATLATGHYKDRHQELFIITESNQIHHCVNEMDDRGSGWRSWRPFADLPEGHVGRRLGMSTLSDNNLKVWAADEDGRLWYASWNKGQKHWSKWEVLDAPEPTTAFAVGQHTRHVEEIFELGSGRAVNHRWHVSHGSESEWHEMPIEPLPEEFAT